MSALCRVCSGSIQYRFRAQGLRETIQKVFNVELNVDGNLLCPLCLYLLHLSRDTISRPSTTVGPRKGRIHCASCDEKSKSSIMYKIEGLPSPFLQLPYFQRLQGHSKSCRVCPKCLTVLEFVKRLIKFIILHVKEIPSPPVPPVPAIVPIPVTLQALVDPPPPPPLMAPPPPPRVEKSAPIYLLPKPTNENPRNPRNSSLYANVKLPEGLTWDQLACEVQVRKNENMRVPPIRIRDLKLQSILKTNSPEKGNKRVSFDNQLSQTREIAPRELFDKEDEQPLVDLSKKKKKTRTSPRISSPAKISKRPRRASTHGANYVEPTMAIVSDCESEEDDQNEGRGTGKGKENEKRGENPPPKKFKVYRPKRRKSFPLPVAPRTLVEIRPAPTVSPLVLRMNGHAEPRVVPSPEKLPVVRNLFQQEKEGGNEPVGVITKKSPSYESSTTNGHQSPGKSPNRRSRRLSVDDAPMVSLPMDSAAMTTIQSPGASPARIANRRKTMDATQHDNANPQYGKLRLVSFEKLRAPVPQIDLLLGGFRNESMFDHGAFQLPTP